MPTPHLTFEEQVGQVVVAAWPGEPEALGEAVALGRVGGLLLRPAASRAEGALAADLARLQRLATYPLLCLADAEGGLGPFVPGALTLAAARRPELAYRAGALAAAEARTRGAQVVLAPPLDVPREASHWCAGASFGDNPSLVARLGAAFVEGCQAMGAMAVGRHFPGRGGAACDAARGLQVLAQDRASLDKIDLLPYAKACRVGLGAIMSGHLHVAALDTLPTRLATHSSAVVQGLLRGTLAFQGLLLTDNLDAPEVSAHYGAAEAAVLAFAAGHDLLVTGHPQEVYRALYEVLLHGDIPAARLAEALGRIWAARRWLGLAGEARPAAWSAELERGPELAQEVARASLVAVHGRREPVARPRPLLVAHRQARPDGSLLEDDLRALAAARWPGSHLHLLDPRPAAEQLEEVMAAAGGADSALVFLDLPWTQPQGRLLEAMAALAAALKRAGLPVGVVLMGNPVALPRWREADLLVYLPGDGAAALEAALACLGGGLEAAGRLPLMVPGLG